MYWQVYLHKTSVAYERMLISALLRAKELASKGVELFASPALKFFLYNHIDPEVFYNNQPGGILQQSRMFGEFHSVGR